MSVKSCISKIKTPGANDKFDKLVKSGMDEYQAARQVIVDEHRSIHDRLNTLKGKLSLPVNEYVAPELPADKLADIEKVAQEGKRNVSIAMVNATKEKQKKAAEKIKLAAEKKEAEETAKKTEEADKKKAEKKAEKKELINVGDSFERNGINWTVTEVGENRVRVTNGSIQTSFDKSVIESLSKEPEPTPKAVPVVEDKVSGVEGEKAEVKKPKLVISSRFSQKQIDAIIENTGVGEKEAVEILHVLETEKDKELAIKKVNAIIANKQSTSLTKLPLRRGSEMTDFELMAATPSQEIVDATSDFENSPREAMANSVHISFMQAKSDLKSDGRVEFDSAVESIDSKGEKAKDKNSLSYDSLFYILSGDTTQRERGIAAAYIAAHRLIGDKNSPLVQLFSKVGKKIRIIYSDTFNIFDEKGKFVKEVKSLQDAKNFVGDKKYKIVPPPILAAGENEKSIIVNAYMLNQRLEEFGGEKRFFNWLEMALYEEAIHLTQYQVATELEMNQIAKEMTKEEKELVADQYGVKVADLTNFQMASEYIRQIVQHDLFGTTTELLKPKALARKYLSNLLKKLVEFFGGKRDKITDRVVKRIENTIRGVNDTARPKIESVEKQVSEKPKAGILEQGDNPVYKVSYKNYQFAIRQLDAEGGPAFFEVEKVKGKWEAKQMLGYSPSEAMVSIKLRVDEGRTLRTSDGDEIIAYADKLEKMTQDERDEVDFYDNYQGYLYYEARKIMPKTPNDPKFKKATENNSYILSNDFDYVANIDGEPYGLTKQEDPDDPDNEKAFVWSYQKMGSSDFYDTFISGNEELIKEIQSNRLTADEEGTGRMLNTSGSENSNDWFSKMHEEFHGAKKRNGDDPIADYSIETGETLRLSEVAFTHAKRANDKNFDASEYMVESKEIAQAEWDIGNIVSDTFLKYDFESAFNYFVDKIKDSGIRYEIRNILARKMIEKFESRPDIAYYLRVKLDLPMGVESGRVLGSRRDFGTGKTGNPENNKTAKPGGTKAPVSVNVKGMWGNDLSVTQGEMITGAIAGGGEILDTKAKLNSINEDTYVSSEVEETLGMMLDQSDERVKELEAEVNELKKKSVKNVNDEIVETLGIMLDQATDGVKQLEKELKESNKQSAELKKEVADLHKKVKDLKSKSKNNDDVIETLGIMVDQAEEKVKKLEEHKKNERLLSSLLKQANEKIKGLESRMSNVGKVANISKIEKEMAAAKSKASMNRLRRFSTANSDKKVIEDLKEKINKIAKLCLA